MAEKVGSAYLEVSPQLKTNTGANDGAAYGNSFSGSMKGAIGAGAVAIGTILADLAKQAAAVVQQFISDTIEVGATYQASMSQVAATLGYTSDMLADPLSEASANYDALSAKAKELGSSTMYSASQAAEGLNILAMSGFTADQSMEMLEDVLHLAAAGSMDMAQAAGYVSGAMKGFNDSTKDAQYYADLMAKGATLANTSVAQLGDAMSSGAATAAAYGQTADSMTLSLLRLAEQGVTGSAAGTALAAAMKNIYTPTDQAKDALDELGIAAYDAEGNARDFNTVVNELDAALAGMSQEEANAYKQTIFGIQGLDAYNKMVVTGTERQEEWAASIATASDGMGSAAEQYGTMTDNLKGSVTSFGSAMEGLQIALFEKVEPALRVVVDAATAFISALTSIFTGELVSQIPGFGEMVDGVFNTIGSVINEVMTFVSGQMAEAWPLIEQIVTDVSTRIQAVIDAVWPFIEKIIGASMSYIQTVMEVAWPAIQSVIQVSQTIIGGIVSTAWNLITSIIDNAINFISSALSAWGVIVDIVKGIFDGVRNAIQGPMDTIKEIVQGAISFIEGIFSGAHLELPHINLPHFNIYGGEAPWGIGGVGTPPKIDIEWYAKGGFVDGATLIGAGEAGPEMILPRQGGLMDEFASTVASKVSGISINGPVTVIADDPEDFIRQLTSFAARTRAQYA